MPKKKSVTDKGSGSLVAEAVPPPQPDLETASRVVAEARANRAAQCQSELAAVLRKYRCRFTYQLLVVPDDSPETPLVQQNM